MVPLFGWSNQLCIPYSLLLQPFWLPSPRWLVNLYISIYRHVASTAKMSNYSNIYDISRKYLWLCMSRCHRSPSASMAFCAWQLQQLRRRNAYWIGFCLTRGKWEIDPQIFREMRCDLIQYHKRQKKAKQKRMSDPRNMAVDCKNWRTPTCGDVVGGIRGYNHGKGKHELG